MTINDDQVLDPSNPRLEEGCSLAGYRVTRKRRLKEIDGFYYELIHDGTGARHLHISRKDTENTFALLFKTVPRDGTGVAHILEHTVLCGSRNYPVRDPFFSMIKRSLNTFMNAFTASDWTMYPFSTENRTDFYNLLGVYLDATFFPLLDELSFKQEGHRIAIEKNMGENEPPILGFKGVVFNEMKGAMSSQSQVMARSLLNALYPDTTYSNNSGGDPITIPNLTYDQLKRFHEVHYHPSNAFFYTYGDMPLKEHLSFIEKAALSSFSKIDPVTEVLPQKRWDIPREKLYTYPIGAHENPDKQAQVCLAWLMADTTESFEVLSLIILENILLGNSASPLRKALIDSELGSSLSDGTGFDSENKDTMFACGLKNTDPLAAPQIENLILNTLRHLSDNGIDKSLVEAAIHQIEFHRKEITNTPYPYGLKIFLWITGLLIHGGDPVKGLLIDQDLERLNHELKQGRFLENQIRRYFLENNHRVRMILVPDKEKSERENRELMEKLTAIHSLFTDADFEKVKRDNEALNLLQEQKEDLSCLPTLGLKEIPPAVKTVSVTDEIPSPPLFCYHQSTGGIYYFSAISSTKVIPERLIEWVPFFAASFSRVGTKNRSYVELARMIDAKTGGIGLSANARTRYDGAGSLMPFVAISGKCLNRNLEELYLILKDLLLSFSFEDRKRLKILLSEYQAGMESALIHNGHRLAISLSCRHFSEASHLNEIWHGIHQLRFIKQLNTDFTEEKLVVISENLFSIGELLFHRDNFQAALVGEAEPVRKGEEITRALQNALPNGKKSQESVLFSLKEGVTCEGYYTHSSVSFVAKSFQAVKLEHEDAPALSIISKMIKSLYLHREIREKGGAYGGYAIYNAEDGLFSFASYRDPHIIETLNAFNGACDFIRMGSYTDEDIREAILQVCSAIDKPETPGAAARKAFFRKMVGLSDEIRLAYKEKLLSISRKEIQKVAETYFNPDTMKSGIAVISGKEQLEAANLQLKDSPLSLNAI